MTSAGVRQNKVLHLYLSKAGIDKQNKKILVREFTRGRSESSADMTYDERNNLIEYLKKLTKPTLRKEAPKKTERTEKEDRMRKKVIALCYNLQMVKENGKIDMRRVNALCIEKGHKKKPLDDYTAEELPVLITQVERIVRDFLKNK